MFYIENGLKIGYSAVCSDYRTYGIKTEKSPSGEIIITDDTTNSYRSWSLDYNQIFDELYYCWLKRIKVKKYSREAYEFERNIGRELNRLTREILNLSWKPRGYIDFNVYHPLRTISAPLYEDRIVEDWLTERFIKPYVCPKLHPYNVACQIDKGPPVAQKFLNTILPELKEKYGNDFYFLQCDIQGYYDNVKHDKIKELFSGMEAVGYKLFCNIIDDWDKSSGYASQMDPYHRYGVPKGNLPSQWVGIMYLNEIDWYLDRREDCLGAVRYMDDFIAFFQKKQSCKDCKIKIEKKLIEEEMGVRLHPKKTVYAPISRGFTFCGFHYRIKRDNKVEMHVKPERKKITKKNFKRITEKYYEGELSLRDVLAKTNGTYAFLNQGTNRGLKRYLSNRYRLTHDPDTFYKKKGPSHRRSNEDIINGGYENEKNST